jgi:hypothetical protein
MKERENKHVMLSFFAFSNLSRRRFLGVSYE